MEHYPINLKLSVQSYPLSQSIKDMLSTELQDKTFIQTELKTLLDNPNAIYNQLKTPELTIEWIPMPSVRLSLLKKVFKRILTLIKIFKLAQPVHIWFIPISSKRYFPKNGEIIDAQHINGGYTYTTLKKIYVYRLEEFPKVMLHEVLHNTKLHIPWNHLQLNRLYTFLNINRSFNFQPTESIVEFWALYYQLLFISYESNKSFTDLINKELSWSLFQTKRLLQYRNKYFKDKWNENSQSYSYIYLKTCFLFFMNQLLKLKIPYTSKDITDFFITRLKDSTFLKAIEQSPLYKTPSFRMTQFGHL